MREPAPGEPGLLTACIVGPFGPTQLACIRSWKANGLRTAFVHLDDDHKPNSMIDKLVDARLTMRHEEFATGAGADRLKEFIEAQRVDGVTAVAYEAARRLHELRAQGWNARTELWLAPAAQLEFLDTKGAQTRLAEGCGMDVAPTAFLHPQDQSRLPAFALPWVLRPDGPTSVEPGFKVEHISSTDALRHFLGRLTKVGRPLIVQPYIEGRNVVVHGARSRSDGQSVHAAFEVGSMLEGVTLTIAPTAAPASLIAACERFAERAGIIGVYHFEFRHAVSDDKYYFLELNGRLGGTTGKVRRLGFDEPMLMAAAFTGGRLGLGTLAQRVVSNRWAVLKAIVRTVRGDLTVFDYPSGGKWGRVVTLLAGFIWWKDELFSIGEARSGWIYMLETLGRKWASR